MPVHPELHAAFHSAIEFAGIKGLIFKRNRQTAHNWVRRAVNRAVERGELLDGRKVSNHTFRHSYARHLLLNGVPINMLQLWMGHRHLSSTLIYLELLGDPTGEMSRIP